MSVWDLRSTRFVIQKSTFLVPPPKIDLKFDYDPGNRSLSVTDVSELRTPDFSKCVDFWDEITP